MKKEVYKNIIDTLQEIKDIPNYGGDYITHICQMQEEIEKLIKIIKKVNKVYNKSKIMSEKDLQMPDIESLKDDKKLMEPVSLSVDSDTNDRLRVMVKKLEMKSRSSLIRRLINNYYEANIKYFESNDKA